MSAIRDTGFPTAKVSPLTFRVASSLASLPHDEGELLAEALLKMLDGRITEADMLAAVKVFRSGKLSRRDALKFLLEEAM